MQKRFSLFRIVTNQVMTVVGKNKIRQNSHQETSCIDHHSKTVHCYQWQNRNGPQLGLVQKEQQSESRQSPGQQDIIKRNERLHITSNTGKVSVTEGNK